MTVGAHWVPHNGILYLCDVNIPAWGIIQASKGCIRLFLRSKINYSIYIFGNPSF
ncbi:hypothetical protein VP01_3105g1 [Puccinia sorghi]|uniref:Uncharacterized protein n=1 Tax=Puccinia sorghi TaxID=27349 RepID=A0A0L6V191_9BASI|nr:hypothetical protein VP01_3105g1 [Puccinia sorghi]